MSRNYFLRPRQRAELLEVDSDEDFQAKPSTSSGQRGGHKLKSEQSHSFENESSSSDECSDFESFDDEDAEDENSVDEDSEYESEHEGKQFLSSGFRKKCLVNMHIVSIFRLCLNSKLEIVNSRVAVSSF